jgi:signal transduction histidine kinase/CheY-like chemotaxis protein
MSSGATDDQFGAIFQIAPIMIYSFDREYRLLSGVGGAFRLDRAGETTVAWDSLTELYSNQPDVLTQLAQVFAGQAAHFIAPFYDLTFEHWVTPLYDAANTIIGGSGFALDISDQRRIEAELRTAKAEAEQASQAKSEFVSRASHELRTPMNAILGFAQLLQADETLNPRQHARVDHILRAGQHLLELINEILDISRIDGGSLTVLLEAIPLAELLEEVLAIMEPTAITNAVTLHADYPPETLGLVNADRQRLTQVLLNILSNAVKYNRRGGSVTVQVKRQQNDFVRIVVSDTGIGIAPHALQQLFSPFERLGHERTSIEGTGLGLALSQRLMMLMGGELGVASVEGQGSDFWLDLPAWSEPLVREKQPMNAITPLVRWKVLYIDPYIDGTHLIEDILSSRNDIRLLRAMQGRLGIELARAQQPDLILLDIALPDMTGEEVLARLQYFPETSHIPAIALSGVFHSNEVENLQQLGARACITKPLTATQLLALLETFAPVM